MQPRTWLSALAILATAAGATSCDAPTPSDEEEPVATRTDALALAESIPELRAMVRGAAGLDGASMAPLVAREEGGFVAGAARSNTAFVALGRAVRATLPASAADSSRLSRVGPDGSVAHEIGVRARGVPSEAQASPRGGAVVYEIADAPVSTVDFARGSTFEELFVVRDPAVELGYDLALEPGQRLEISTTKRTAYIVDHEGARLFELSIPGAWDRDGDEVPASLEADARGVRITLQASGFDAPIVVDPTWADASVPLKLRTLHTATLLPTGEILIAGGTSGGASDESAELYDPQTATTRPTGFLRTPRSGHTATLLEDGRVFIAGGAAVTATEIYDPATGLFDDGPDLLAAEAGVAANLLEDGRVLVSNKTAAEIVDVAANTSTAASAYAIASDITPLTATLADGRVLLVGSNAIGVVSQIFDPATNGFTPTGAGPADVFPLDSTLTRLRDGRVVLTGGCPCGSIGGPDFSWGGTGIFNPVTATWTTGGNFVYARHGHTATLLPNGRILFTGGSDAEGAPERTTAELFDPTTNNVSLVPTPMNNARGAHTATLLPTGDVLLLGGQQASAELYVAAGTGGSITAPAISQMKRERERHTATLLLDGRVLLAGGASSFIGLPTPMVETFDPATNTFTAAADMVTERREHVATLLPDGRVLLSGGVASDGTPLASTELFDPSTGLFVAGPDMSEVRVAHTATLLTDGRVLLAGGRGTEYAFNVTPSATADLFDPTTNTIAKAAGDLPVALERHAAALLPSGRVLLVGKTSAALFDPTADTFSLTGTPGAARNEVEAAVLPSGKVLVTGGSTLAAEIYDPVSGSFAFTGTTDAGRVMSRVTLLPQGQVLVTGGELEAVEPPVLSTTQLFDPLYDGFVAAGSTAIGHAKHTATVLFDGTVLVAGGVGCELPCAPIAIANAERTTFASKGFANKPVISSAPTSGAGGELVSITGVRLRGLEGSSGRYGAAPANYPIACWQSLLYGAVTVGRITAFDDTSATWQIPSTAYTGPGLLRVVVNGVPSEPVLFAISSATQAAPCEFDADCASGSCADGVCCDSPCDGSCEGCTAARKGSGVDGECGPVPPELDPNDACVVSDGAPCTTDGQCESGFCVDGVCCAVACTEQCEACDVEGSFGTCVPVTGAPHGDRLACSDEPASDPCSNPVCDGVTRATCEGVVGPCSPFACGDTACLSSCDTDDECATGFHCEDHACVAGKCDGSQATTPEGDVIDCSPYTCQPDGSCRTSCADVTDCAEPFACNSQLHCVARPPPSDTTSCACRAAGTEVGSRAGSRMLTLLGLVLAATTIARRRRRTAPLVSAGVVVAFATNALAAPPKTPPTKTPDPTPQPAAPPEDPNRAAAEEHFKRGLEHYDASAWAPALAEFLESRHLYPTRAATQNAAFCLAKLGRNDEALDLYEALLREFPKLDEQKKREVAQAITALRGLVGTIEIDGAEPDATIVIDGRIRGTYPPEAPLRVGAGGHVVRVYKKGFEPFETQIDVAGRAVARVEVQLAELKESGTLKVVEKSGKSLAVLVDQVEVGVTPFEGEVAVGKHVVTLRGEDGSGVAPTAAPIEKNQTTALELSAVMLDSKLRVVPTPAAAQVIVNDVAVGLGTWEGALPAGTHHVQVAAAGFLAHKQDVTIGPEDPGTIAISLERDESDERWKIPAKFTLEASGALALFPSYFGGVENQCGDGCSAGVGLGGAVLLHAAYELGIGVGFGLTGGYMSTQHKVTGRASFVQPVGREAREGAIDDVLQVKGGLVGAHVHYHFGESIPVLLRLGVGALIGTTYDERSGSFQLDDGFTYQAGPVVQEPFTVAVFIAPEVRVAYKVTQSFEVSLGFSTLVFIDVVRPEWDPSVEVNAAIDGIGAFAGEDLNGPAWFVIAPSVGARYAF
ncbi:MAG: kelch repeat-containing protein [Polyangiaceae bacterium]